MDASRPCKNCRRKTLVPDDVTGNMVCSSCGVVQDFDNFQAHMGGITGIPGTYVRMGTVGSGTVHNYKEKKISEAQKVIVDFMFRLELSGLKEHEVKLLVEKITDGEYGQGNWFPVLVGACAYVVMRKDHKMLPIVHVADLVGCDVYELGRMISRVVDFVGLKLPEFDIVNSFERTIKICPSFSHVPENVVQRMLEQGVFLVQCLIKWFVITGRRPMPVVAAVLVFVGELNQIHVKIDDVANDLRVSVTTCRLRYKELLERLVSVARVVLPWGKDVTVKNILNNAPCVMQYLEMKSTAKKGRDFGDLLQWDMETIVVECLKETEYGYDNSYTKEDNNSSHYFEVENCSSHYSDKFLISPESLTKIYHNFLDEISVVKATAEIGVENHRKRRKHTLDLQACRDWWRGKSDLSKKLYLKQILEKDLGLDFSPPCFDKGCLATAKRREKIEAAKLRIRRIMDPGVASCGYSNDLSLFPRNYKKMKRKRVQVDDIDWEDLIIETLLLHNVKEEEIENGHYNVLLALHVFNDVIGMA